MAQNSVIAADPGAGWSRDFSRTFARQYTIGREVAVPDEHGWRRVDFAGLVLEHCPHLPVRRLSSATDGLEAALIGVAVDARDATVGADSVLPDGGFGAFEAWLHGLAGRYVILAAHHGVRRLYLDAASDMAAVFDPRTGRVASSLLLALQHGIEENPRASWRERIKGGLGYAFGHTPDAHVRRMITNHRLDLDTLEQTRHWPAEGAAFEAPADVTAAARSIDRIVARLGAVVCALSRSHECAMPLSGGWDSRGLLGSARKAGAGEMVHYTHVTNRMSGIDAVATRRIAEVAGLNCDVIPASDPRCAPMLSGTQARRVKWAYAHANGLQSFGPDERVRAVNAVVPAPELTLRGNIMDMTRANQWPGDPDRAGIDQALGRLRLAPTREEAMAEWGEDYEAWMDTLPACAAPRFRDFAFTEQLLPNSTGGGFLLSMNRSFVMNPFNDRELIGLTLSFEPAFRRAGTLNRTLIAHADGQLSALPYTNQLKHEDEVHVQARQIAA